MAWIALAGMGLAAEPPADAARWLDRFAFVPPAACPDGAAPHAAAELPEFAVEPQAHPAPQLVRVSLPFGPGALAEGLGVVALAEGQRAPADLRVLSYHPGRPRWVRRVLVTFPWTFAQENRVAFRLQATPPSTSRAAAPRPEHVQVGAVVAEVAPDQVVVRFGPQEMWRATLLAPPLSAEASARWEVIEHGPHYAWVRLLVADPQWPRIVELQLDALGGAVVQAHLQRRAAGDAYAPSLGWQIVAPEPLAPQTPHEFAAGAAVSYTAPTARRRVTFPDAGLKLKGRIDVSADALAYLRSRPEDRVPMQSAAWRRCSFALDRPELPPRTSLLEPGLRATAGPRDYDALYACGVAPDLQAWPDLVALTAFTRDALAASALRGDDHGNVTGYNPAGPPSVYGMNRLNHCPPIFHESYRSGDARLRDLAVQWCGNMHDLSIWWGDDEDFGGTRYNNAVADGQPILDDGQSFMWRTNGGRHTFCTKGYDSFFYAYEETGDPRMATALRHQAAYAAAQVRANRGEARNIGDVADFLRLHRFTGVPAYREQALRLFRELREGLGPDGLFSQDGRSIEQDRPFLDDDALGSRHPFAKPYILGYALAGCPDLLQEFPDEPRLADMVRSVAAFQARTVDPVGGWRYPAPESSGVIIGQGMEHAAQLVRAAEALQRRGEPIESLLDAIEIVLQARLQGFVHTGQILAGLNGWERSTGHVTAVASLHALYARPADRERTRDYAEGAIGVGGAPPEGLVYLPETLSFYLRHRPAERLRASTPELAQILDRLQ